MQCLLLQLLGNVGLGSVLLVAMCPFFAIRVRFLLLSSLFVGISYAGVNFLTMGLFSALFAGILGVQSNLRAEAWGAAIGLSFSVPVLMVGLEIAYGGFLLVLRLFVSKKALDSAFALIVGFNAILLLFILRLHFQESLNADRLGLLNSTMSRLPTFCGKGLTIFASSTRRMPDPGFNPYETTGTVPERGKILYDRLCRGCHSGGPGDAGLDLTDDIWLHRTGEQISDRELYEIIFLGIPAEAAVLQPFRGPCPSHPELVRDDIWRIVAYVRSIGKHRTAPN